MIPSSSKNKRSWSVIFACNALECSKKMRCQHRTSWKCYCVYVGLQNKMHMFLGYFLSFITSKITEKLNLPKRLLAKLQPFFVDVTIIVLTQPICILELSNQVLKLACFKDLEWNLMFPPCIMCVQYIGGCSVHRGVFSTSGGYHEYIGGISWVHRGDIMYIGGISWVHLGDTMSTSGDVQYIGGYHEYIGGISWVHRGMFSTSEFSIEIERILSSCSPTCIMIFLRCTEHPPMYSWYPPDVLMVSLLCTEHPPMYSWYPPDEYMVSPRCTEHPPMYWTSPDVLNTHYTGGFYKM